MQPLHGRSGIVHSTSEKLDAFADHLQYTHEGVQLESFEGDSEFERTIENTLSSLPELSGEPLRPVHLEEVAHIIKNLKLKKAPGLDITNNGLKKLPVTLTRAITNVSNGALSLGHFPDVWKEAGIILLPKPDKDPLFPQNYRPISLLSGLAKILEYIIHKPPQRGNIHL